MSPCPSPWRPSRREVPSTSQPGRLRVWCVSKEPGLNDRLPEPQTAHKSRPRGNDSGLPAHTLPHCPCHRQALLKSHQLKLPLCKGGGSPREARAFGIAGSGFPGCVWIYFPEGRPNQVGRVQVLSRATPGHGQSSVSRIPYLRGHHPRKPEGCGQDSPSEPPEGTHPTDTLLTDSWPPETLLLQTSEGSRICNGGPKN